MNVCLPFSFLTFIAVTKTLLTKYVFVEISTPVAYSTLSCIVTAICIVPAFKCVELNYMGKNFDGILMASIMIALDLAFTNISLSILTISLQQCIKATLPADVSLCSCSIR